MCGTAPAGRGWPATRSAILEDRHGDKRSPRQPPARHPRPIGPTPSATWCWSATPGPARRHWSRPCSSRPGRSPGPAGSRTAPRSPTSTRPRSASSGRVSLALAPLAHDGVKVNLLDTPGYADFVGDLRAGLRAADAALFVVSAVDGIDGTTRLLWEECAAVGMPRAVVVTKLDQPRADFDETLAACQRVFGDGVHAALPADARRRRHGRRADRAAVASGSYDYSGGQRESARRTPSTWRTIEAARGALIEGIIAESEDETLMDRYLGGEDIDLDDPHRRPREGGRPRLVLPGDPGRRADRRRRARAARAARPAASRRRWSTRCPPVTTPAGDPRAPLACDPAGPLVAEVVKTTTRPVRRPDQPGPGLLRHAPPRHRRARLRPFGVLRRGPRPRGPRRRRAGRRAVVPARQDSSGPWPRASPATSARSPSWPGPRPATRCPTRTSPLLMEPWVMPEPLLPVAIVAARQGRRGQARRRACSGWSPRTRPCGSRTTRRPTSWCCGAWARRTSTCCSTGCATATASPSTRSRCGCRCARRSPAPAKGHGRHVKQSGGHGQFAVCDIEVEPLPQGAGFEFVDKVVGGAVPRQFIPSRGEGRARPDGARASPPATRWSTSGSP